MTTATRAWARARDALARLDRAVSHVRCPDLVLYRSARCEAIDRGEALLEHAPGVPAVDPAEEPPITAVLRGEAWLADGCPGGWRGLLRDLHWELMQGRDPGPGAFRSAPSWLGGPDPARARRRFPEARLVPLMLAALERRLRTERDPLLAAAGAHARLALLHPFRDGNGRVAHALVPVVLRQRGLLSRPCLLLGTAFRARKRAYYSALDRLWSGDDRPWTSFFLSALEGAAIDTASACAAIREGLEIDERRLPNKEARHLLLRLSRGALPLGEVARVPGGALDALRRARIAKVARGFFGEPMVFHTDLARIVAGGGGRGCVQSRDDGVEAQSSDGRTARSRARRRGGRLPARVAPRPLPQ